MKQSQLAEKIINIIKDNNIMPGGNVIDEHTALYDECGLDSIGVIDLVVCIEEQFDFEFKDIDLELSNFATVSNIANLVKLKL